MALYNQVFPVCVGNDMEGGPRYIAEQAFSQSGQRAFNLYDAEPLREYSLREPIRSGEDFEEVRAFFHATRGVDTFLFRDPSDCTLTQANSSLTLISGSTYQLNRLYIAPGRTTVRRIQKPAAGLQIFRTRSGVTTNITSGGASIAFSTGIVTISGHVSGDTYAAAGEFYVPVYFADPVALYRVFGGPRMLTEWPDITLRESREIA